MEPYYWDTRIDYLRSSRDLYYNNDFIKFLVKSVWKIEAPVHLIDFGCISGYLGLKLFTAAARRLDLNGCRPGEKLLDEARSLFKPLPYESDLYEPIFKKWRAVMSLVRKPFLSIKFYL